MATAKNKGKSIMSFCTSEVEKMDHEMESEEALQFKSKDNSGSDMWKPLVGETSSTTLSQRSLRKIRTIDRHNPYLLSSSCVTPDQPPPPTTAFPFSLAPSNIQNQQLFSYPRQMQMISFGPQRQVYPFLNAHQQQQQHMMQYWRDILNLPLPLQLARPIQPFSATKLYRGKDIEFKLL
ncbi:hypothetical protein Bca52824_078657 [Brassica carinata]|uniref:Uncharacterized protein n=1 Tax=Brassica carinata TaxID=52824 RepID=A0A8X7PY09_BRACI|nr:hypothetical protein Bca52824_078657 [Brassica carinata]